MIAAPPTENPTKPQKDELLKNHEKLQLLFEQVEIAKTEWEQTMDCVPEMVVLTNIDGFVRRCNKTFADYLNKGYGEILGQNLIFLLRKQELPVTSFAEPHLILRQESHNRWFELKRHPFTTKGANNSSGFVITISDITMQKKFSEQLEEKNRQIMIKNEHLNEKNAELAHANAALKASQSQVLQQEKMASIGQLAAGVAHEINNPIGFITSNLNSLAKYLARMTEFIHLQKKALVSPENSFLRDEIHEKEKTMKLDFILDDSMKIIEESLDGSERVQRIVQNLKSFSRNDDGKCVAADINECFESAATIVWNEIKYKATLTKELGTLPRTICYPNQLNQVFINMLINAVQAIEEQGAIRVRTWHQDRAIWASVSDTGCGIPPEIISRVFEPFFTTKEVGTGTGLGLSITYEVIKRHNGNIWVESSVGEGSTFTFRIPVVEVD